MLPITYDGFTLRLATNDDSDQVVQLIDSVYQEYGDSIALQDADADLLDFQKSYFDKGGYFSVLASHSGSIVASHAVLPLTTTLGTFKRLYLLPKLRGGVWGNILMNWALLQAQFLDLSKIEFWSDARFHRAHQYFERFGFRHDGRIRKMDDGNMPYSEKYFCVDIKQSTLAEPYLPSHAK